MGAADAGSSVRLFMAPGVQHCAGGPGPDNFGQFGYYPATPQGNMRLALEQWVEKGVAPETIIAAKYVNQSDPFSGVKMTRPLCAWPKMAKYKGSGDVNDAANWECAKQ
jgi:feruloyl esterase